MRLISPSIVHRIRRDRAARREPIYLVSASGQPNFGDELITRAWLDWLAARAPQREVWLDSIEPGRAAHLFRDTHPRLKTTNTLWQTVHTNLPSDVLAAADRVETLLDGLGSPRNDAGLRDLRGMGSIHLLGGGYLNTIWSQNLALVAAMTHLKRRYGTRLFATGQGLLPHDASTRAWMKAQLAQFDYVESRDRKGSDMFDVVAGSDDAFLAFSGGRRVFSASDRLPHAMILVQGGAFTEGRSERWQGIVDHFAAAADDGLGFVEALPPDDMAYLGEHPGTGARLFPFMSLWDEGFPAASTQAWLTTRFHAHLLAAGAGARGVVVEADPDYYGVKHELLAKLGTGWTVWDADERGRPPEPEDATVNPEFPVIAKEIGRAKSLLAAQLYLG